MQLRHASSLISKRRIMTTILAAMFMAIPGKGIAQIGGSDWTVQTPDFKVQWPYNLPEGSRYTYDPSTGIYHLWVDSSDEPFRQGSTTLPRTEQRFLPDYTSGEVQYQAMLMGDPTENSYCIFQIHTGDAQSTQYGSTTFMLFWFSSDGGSVHDYSGTELASNLGSNWFQLNVDHNLVTHTITVWINKKQVWQQPDNGASDFYMKDGVYEQNHNPTPQMDAWVKDIQFWVSPGTTGTADYSLSTPSPSSLTLQPGKSATVNLTVTPQNGFDSPVSFACSGAPADVTCGFSPATVTPSGSAVSSALTVSDAADGVQTQSLGIYGAAVMTLIFLGWRKRKRWPIFLLLFLVGSAGMVTLAGCGSSSESSPSNTSTSAVTVITKSGT